MEENWLEVYQIKAITGGWNYAASKLSHLWKDICLQCEKHVS